MSCLSILLIRYVKHKPYVNTTFQSLLVKYLNNENENVFISKLGIVLNVLIEV